MDAHFDLSSQKSPGSTGSESLAGISLGDGQFREPVTAQQYAYKVIRRAVMHGVLAPGTRLTQNEIAAKLSMSTTPVREALRRLASEGVVRIDAYRGAVVRGLDAAELSEIYELRILLEPLAVRKAVPKLTDAELNAAQGFIDNMSGDVDVDVWVEANRNFHNVLTRVADSPNLTPIVKSLRDSAAPYVRLSIVVGQQVPKKANEEHQQLLDACLARDADRAAHIEELHLRRTLAVIMSNPTWPPGTAAPPSERTQ